MTRLPASALFLLALSSTTLAEPTHKAYEFNLPDMAPPRSTAGKDSRWPYGNIAAAADNNELLLWYLFKDGVIHLIYFKQGQFTDLGPTAVKDGLPSINSAGDIVTLREIAPPTRPSPDVPFQPVYGLFRFKNNKMIDVTPPNFQPRKLFPIDAQGAAFVSGTENGKFAAYFSKPNSTDPLTLPPNTLFDPASRAVPLPTGNLLLLSASRTSLTPFLLANGKTTSFPPLPSAAEPTVVLGKTDSFLLILRDKPRALLATPTGKTFDLALPKNYKNLKITHAALLPDDSAYIAGTYAGGKWSVSQHESETLPFQPAPPNSALSTASPTVLGYITPDTSDPAYHPLPKSAISDPTLNLDPPLYASPSGALICTGIYQTDPPRPALFIVLPLNPPTTTTRPTPAPRP